MNSTAGIYYSNETFWRSLFDACGKKKWHLSENLTKKQNRKLLPDEKLDEGIYWLLTKNLKFKRKLLSLKSYINLNFIYIYTYIYIYIYIYIFTFFHHFFNLLVYYLFRVCHNTYVAGDDVIFLLFLCLMCGNFVNICHRKKISYKSRFYLCLVEIWGY